MADERSAADEPRAPEPDPRNMPGPFYVERNMCMTCGVPPSEAPGLIHLDDEGCYFKKQPETEAELAAAIEAMWFACCGAYRYGGDDPEIVRRLLAAGIERGQIDRQDLAPLPSPHPERRWRWPWRRP